MERKEILELLKTSPEYKFLYDHERLGSKVGMLCLGGSLAYGTNIEGKGDVDLRGFAFESKPEVIGLHENFGQVVETNTDTTIYSFRKLITLLMDNNPNTIEMLGGKPENYFYLSTPAKIMLENKKRFLSKKCVRAFAGYANQQLNRLENAIARDRLTQSKKEEHIRLACLNSMASFEDRYVPLCEPNGLKLYIDASEKETLDTEIFIDIQMKHYPVRDLNSMLNELGNVVRTYNKINHRNKKKDEEHLDKHAMHLLRLYYMAFDLLENMDVVTYREKERDFLLEVRKGKFRKPDGTYSDEFFELRKELEKRFEYDVKHTELPDGPDLEWINQFVMYVNDLIVADQL